mgnify:CR=1 FL=1
MGFRHMYVVFDNAYFAGEFTDLLDELGYTRITKSRTNRVVEDEYGIYTPISEVASTIDPRNTGSIRNIPTYGMLPGSFILTVDIWQG